MEDKEIISLYNERSENAIKETDNKYGTYLRKISDNILGDRGDTEECMNDSYLKVWNSIPPQVPKILKAFVARITRNTALNIYEKRKASKRCASEVALSLEELEECLEGRDNVVSEIERKEIMKALDDFLGTLDKKKRILFVQRYFYLESLDDIAGRNDISGAALRTMLCRTRTELKEFLKKRGLF
jgi:RNA polymerase sigma-70 factor (ECF subfamily)